MVTGPGRPRPEESSSPRVPPTTSEHAGTRWGASDWASSMAPHQGACWRTTSLYPLCSKPGDDAFAAHHQGRRPRLRSPRKRSWIAVGKTGTRVEILTSWCHRRTGSDGRDESTSLAACGHHLATMPTATGPDEPHMTLAATNLRNLLTPRALTQALGDGYSEELPQWPSKLPGQFQRRSGRHETRRATRRAPRLLLFLSVYYERDGRIWRMNKGSRQACGHAVGELTDTYSGGRSEYTWHLFQIRASTGSAWAGWRTVPPPFDIITIITVRQACWRAGSTSHI